MNKLNLAFQKISEPSEWLTGDRTAFLDQRFVPLYSFYADSGLLSKTIKKWIDYEVTQEIHALCLDYEDLFEQEPFLESLTRNSESSSIKNILFYSWLWWNTRLESLYLGKKTTLDKVTCRLLTVSDKNLAYELYMRLKEKEASFDQLSLKYGVGPERFRGGSFASQSLSSFSPQMQKVLASMTPGQLMRPFPSGDNFCLLQLESLESAEFSHDTKKRLLLIQFNEWRSEISQNIINYLSTTCHPSIIK